MTGYFSRSFGALAVLLASLLALSACGGDTGGSGSADAGTSSDTVQVLGDGTSSAACTPLGSTRCAGNDVELCSDAGWTLDEACGESGLTCQEGLCQTIEVECATITPIRTILNEPTLSSVAAVFAVDTCDGQPVAGLTVDDFTILEDAKEISATEAQAAILSRNSSVYISLVMDNSPSVAAVGALEQAVESALIFVDEVMSGTSTENVFMSVAFFSKKLEMMQDYTTDIDLVKGALEALLDDDSGSNTTNLYGALIDAINENKSHRTDVENAADGGIIAIGQVVLFTDGSDQAALASYEDATAAVLMTDADVITISLGGELEVSVLEALGKNGAYLASESDQLLSTFEEAAQKAKALQKRVYVLGYCSPKLAGEHELTLVLGDGFGTSPGITFDADPFNSDVATCSSSLFESACDTKNCGGLLCGACDDGAYCLAGDRCPCDGLVCGTEAGVDCGSCTGSTEYCAPDQSECLDACADVACGPGQVNCSYDFDLPDCCSAHPTPGCELGYLEDEVCYWLGLDECCEEEWSETCALAVNTYFGFICQVPDDVNSECVAESITCGTCDGGSYCSADQSACTDACLSDGGQPLVCEEGQWTSTECPSGLVELSNCCFAHGGADCDTGGSFELGQMKSEVCSQMPECCDTAWDDSCVALAKGVYGWEQGCVPDLGDCIAYGPLGCGSCDPGYDCSDDQLACLNMCLTVDGEAVICGTSPTDGVTDCGSCGEGQFCSSDGTACGDACAGLVCGPSPVDGSDCGSCAAGEFCAPDGSECGDACAGMDCGTSPLDGQTSCGSCTGNDYCLENVCADACLGLACGPSTVPGIECGTCGAPNICVDGVCSCGSDADCSPGTVCFEGGCYQQSCTTDADCGPGIVCFEGGCSDQCVADCDGLSCGDDGCGGSCGACQPGHACVNGECECTPACAATNGCGDDGCGGTCGTCPGGFVCQGAIGTATCVDAGGGCNGMTYEGCCDGQVLMWCENGTVESIDCTENPSCGWQAESGFYNCQTNGAEESSGQYPIACPGG